MSKSAVVLWVMLMALVGCTERSPEDRAKSPGVAVGTRDSRSARSNTRSLPGSPSVSQRLRIADSSVAWDSQSQLVVDLDCDGAADSAFVGRSQSAIHVGILRAKVPTPEILPFGIGSARQDAVCSGSATLSVESLDYDPTEAVGELDGFQRSLVCKGLNLGEGDCDSIHFFWNAKSGHLDWWRA